MAVREPRTPDEQNAVLNNGTCDSSVLALRVYG